MTLTARGLTIIGLVAFLLIVLVPFWWIASMSFKTYEQVQFATSIYVPRPFTWENYTVLWTATRPAPSTNAASSSSVGSALKNPIRSHVQKGTVNVG